MKLNLQKFKYIFSPGEILFPFGLITVVVVISYQNYIPGTYLSGWDTLHPEFDFIEYFRRVFSVWQQHQGLGAPPAQANAAELPRLIIYYLSSLILPQQILRYVYFFATLSIGSLGVYFFVQEVIKNKIDGLSKNIIAFLSGLFYLLNLATLQTFAVPLEMFATYYASLGWIFLFATKYLIKPKKKSLLFFVLSIIFATPMAHTPTLFYIFFLLFAFYLFAVSKLSQVGFKSSCIILFLIILLNLYWIVPNLYYVKTHGEDVVDSKIHSQFSDRAFDTGRNFTDLRDMASLKNFLFDWGEYDEHKGSFKLILQTWQQHLKQPRVVLVGFLFFGLVLVGISITIVNREIVGLGLLPLFVISYFFIANDNFVFNFFYNIISDKSQILKEALRFPYTKFSIILIFIYSVYFAYALSFLVNYFSKRSVISKLFKVKVDIISSLCLVIFSTALIYYMYPAFSGHLINSKMRVNIPSEYFKMFDWFKKQNPNERIAPFPVHTYWAWVYYSWGYEGAGFDWFGLRQPIMDREFDRWMPYNENYYWEISYALYSQNLDLFEKVLDKYQVKWLMLDENVVDASSPKSTYYKETEDLISKSNKISLATQFNRIKIYRVQNNIQADNFITVLRNPKIVEPKYKWSNIDLAYLENGDYVIKDSNSSQQGSQIYYPFRSLFTNHKQSDIEFNIEEFDNYLLFTQKLPKDKSYSLESLHSGLQSIPWYDPGRLDVSGEVVPTISVSNSVISVKVPKVNSFFSAQINPTREIQIENTKNCNSLSESKLDIAKVTDEVIGQDSEQFLRLKTILGNNCSASFWLPNLSHKLSYLIFVKSRNISGRNLQFWLGNKDLGRSELDVLLPKSSNFVTSYLIQPPEDAYGLGYDLHFDNWSFNKSETVNDLGKIEVYPIPYDFLIHISLTNKDIVNYPEKQISLEPEVFHPSTSYYKVGLNNIQQNLNLNQILVLYQSFDYGWHAYWVKGLSLKELKGHVLVNNWANGWILEPSKEGTVIIFYLPQLLHFFGILVFAGTVYLLIHNELISMIRSFSETLSKLTKKAPLDN